MQDIKQCLDPSMTFTAKQFYVHCWTNMLLLPVVREEICPLVLVMHFELQNSPWCSSALNVDKEIYDSTKTCNKNCKQ